jgi:uncharacterized protein (AIM24 family)
MPRSPTPERDGAQPAPPGDGAAPHPGDERSTERKLIASAPISAADSTRDAAQEDFLFHLYRGSELLQENRVLEAKEELEFALTMQPRDAKGQDLLAAVYFRIGLYPRAITIYEQLEKQFPRDTSLKVNLALCYLKTGQPDPARIALHEVVRINPNHRRAWGYLGIVHEKSGDFDQAQVAFERGGHLAMAKRMTERRNRVTVPAPAMPVGNVGAQGEVREVAGMAFEELDAGELNFALAEPGSGKTDVGVWHAVELGAEKRRAVKPTLNAPPGSQPGDDPVPSAQAAAGPSPYSKTLSPPSIRQAAVADGEAAENHAAITTPPPPPASQSHAHVPTPVISLPPPEMAQAARASMLIFPEELAVVLHPSGVALVHVREGRAFSARIEAMRLVKGTITTTILQRKTRDKDAVEILGGVGSPIVGIEGHAELVLGARSTFKLLPLTLQDDLAFVREDLLLGFEQRLAYENGRLLIDEGDSVPIVQLRGTGAIVLELLADFATVTTEPGRSLVVRRDWIVGWIGRLVPRAVPQSEAPGAQRGLVSFNGDGTVLVAGR